MSKPFFIWTMRRTGGTSLMSLLTQISEYHGIQHEPFNADRQLGKFIKDFRKGEDKADIKDGLEEVFKKQPLIKHCYEIFGIEFNNLLVEAINPYGYQHIFLMRKDDISRIMSLYLAMQTSVWGADQKKAQYQKILSGEISLKPFDIDAMLKHYEWSSFITSKIQELLKEKGIEYKIVYFDDIYTGEREERIEKLYNLFDYLEFDDSVKVKYKDLIEEKIFNNSQDSISVLKYIPNYEDAKNIFSESKKIVKKK